MNSRYVWAQTLREGACLGHRHVGRGHGTYGVLAHDSAASHLEIKAAGEGVAGDEEELLLEADVGLDALDVVADVLEEARALLAHRLHTVATSRVSIHPSRSGARHARAPVPRGECPNATRGSWPAEGGRPESSRTCAQPAISGTRTTTAKHTQGNSCAGNAGKGCMGKQ